jgi:predicted esterase
MRAAVSSIVVLSLALTGCGGDDGAGAADAGVDAAPVHAFTPQPTGVCPPIQAGAAMFAPAGVAPRMVQLTLDAAATAKGPLLLYWHATGSSPAEAQFSIGNGLGAFTAAGGVVAAPFSDPTAGMFEWFIVNQRTEQDDFLLADEILACLAAAGKIDTDRVHSWGMSAGALQTTAMSFLRSSYIASVATYSGGVPSIFQPPPLDPGNPFSAMIFHGGPTDSVFNIDFEDASERYRTLLDDAGHFTAMCNHGDGHTIPRPAGASVLQFFADNAYGRWPSPYEAAGLPGGFPAYCVR